jgi:hypothetical protein
VSAARLLRDLPNYFLYIKLYFNICLHTHHVFSATIVYRKFSSTDIFVFVLLISIFVALSVSSNFRTFPKCDYRIEEARDHNDRNQFHQMMLHLCLEKLSGIGIVQVKLHYVTIYSLISHSSMLHKQTTHNDS